MPLSVDLGDGAGADNCYSDHVPLYRFLIGFSIFFRFFAGCRRGDRDKNPIDKTHRPRYPQV